MAADSDTSGLDIRRANRRGFLMGVTLAELMLITLFVLLLLLEDFGQLEEDLGGRQAAAAARTLAKDVKAWASQREQPLPDIWSTLVPGSDRPRSDLEVKLEKTRRELAEAKSELTDANQRLNQAQSQQSELEENLRDERSRNKTLQAELVSSNEELAAASTDRARAARHLEQEQKRLAELESDLKRARTRIEALNGRTAGTKEGGLVLCAYEPPEAPGTPHGKSVALGTVHLQNDGITLIHTRAGLRNLKVVDKVGDPYDLTDALDQLDSWPVGTKRTFEAFRQWGKEFVRIGDRESKTRQNCRFSMGFYFDDGVDLDVLTGVFEHYFFRQPQNSITREEFQRLVSETTGSDDR